MPTPAPSQPNPRRPVPHARSALLAAVVGCMVGLAEHRGSAVEGRQELFDGRTLNGWHTWLVDTGRSDPRGVFTVTNGTLRISGDGLGYLATEQEFDDFRLEVEWRWGTVNTAWGDRVGRARDSGIFLHATGPDGNSHDGNGAFMAAIECNLFQGATGDILLIRGTAADGTVIAPRLTAEVRPEVDRDGWPTWKPGGPRRVLERWGRLNARTKSSHWLDRLDFRGPDDREKPYGEWNRIECEWSRGRLRIRLNGHLVNEARDLKPTRGRILLQCEGSEIHFRRVTVERLP